MIQPNQQSVIQTATNLQPMLGKGNVILVSKPNSVIQTTQGSLSGLQTLQVKVSFDGEMTKLYILETRLHVKFKIDEDRTSI